MDKDYTEEDGKRLEAFARSGQTAQEIIREMRYNLYIQYREWVRKNEIDLRKRYGTDYIAIKANEVMGTSKDKLALAKLTEQKYRGRFVLIGTIDDILNPREEHLDSPETE